VAEATGVEMGAEMAETVTVVQMGSGKKK